jgi:hypothetical protein
VARKLVIRVCSYLLSVISIRNTKAVYIRHVKPLSGDCPR